ncbi:hypothetical protein [Bacteroides xylanisolvens]|uniref:hypothetical protein n=1 Tax=Bacteroides xylanisolvens TaxID=371601 RepID=UPI001BEEA2FC|nr:hypothetical protein [Bacteroides xylanisolvens]QUT23831.1 hypothetical protein INE93_01257 [Bacteroides xylanisolvens]
MEEKKYINIDNMATRLCQILKDARESMVDDKNKDFIMENFSLTDLIEQCYDSFFKCWHEEYEYWANDENAIREELHNNQYEDRLYYMDGRVYSGPLDDVA